MGLDSSEIKILEKTNLFTHVFWTKEDIVCLIENWGKKNISEIAKMIGKSPKAVSRKAARIRKKDNTLCPIKGDQNSYPPFVRGEQRLLTLMEKLQDSLNENTPPLNKEVSMYPLKEGGIRFWNPAQTKWLVENWGKIPTPEIAKTLGKSPLALRNKIKRIRDENKKMIEKTDSLYLRSPGKSKTYGNIWTPEEINYLRENWGKKHFSEITHFLGRTQGAISVKASLLKLGSRTLKNPSSQNNTAPLIVGKAMLPESGAPLMSKEPMEIRTSNNSSCLSEIKVSDIQKTLSFISQKLPANWDKLSIEQKNSVLESSLKLMLLSV